MTSNELTISHAQKVDPWSNEKGIAYSGEMQVCAYERMPHLYASHCVLHAMKSIGKIATIFEKLDHTGEKKLTEEQLQILKDMSGDLLIEALRFANLYNFDLAQEYARRVADKNNGFNVLEESKI